jgi:hypothetical protein
MIFLARHPDRKGKKLVRGEPGFDRLATEWLDMRDRLVKPGEHLAQTTNENTRWFDTGLVADKAAFSRAISVAGSPDCRLREAAHRAADGRWYRRSGA